MPDDRDMVAERKRRGILRFLLQICVLVPLAVLEAFSSVAFTSVVGLLLVIAPAINWTVAGILIWTSRQAPEVESLAARADDAVTLALISTAAAGAGAVGLARAFGINIDGHPALVLLAFGLLLVSVPAISWLQTWRTVWLPVVRARQNEKRKRAK